MRNSSKNQPTAIYSSKAQAQLKSQIDQLSCNVDTLAQKHLEIILMIVNGSCETIGDIVKQLKSVNKEVGKSEEFCRKEDGIKLFCDLYLFCFSKFPYKNLFASILLNLVWNEDDLSICLCNSLIQILCFEEESYVTETQVILTIEHVFQTFSKLTTSLLWQKSLWYVTNTLKLHQEILQDVTESQSNLREEIIQNICSDLKCAAVLIQHNLRIKHANDGKVSHLKDNSLIHELLQESSHLLQQDNLGWECWNSVGFLHFLLIYSTATNFAFQFKQTLNWKKVEDGVICSGAYIGLCNGVLAFTNTNLLKSNHFMENGIKLTNESTEPLVSNSAIEDIFDVVNLVFIHLMKLAEKVKNVPHQITLAKCFVQWTITMKNLLKLQVEVDWEAINSTLKSLQLYATVSLDHPVDVIRHQAKDIMVNILTISDAKTQGTESVSFARELVRDAFSWDWHKRSVYMFLKCSANFVDIEFLLQQDKNLVEKLLKASSHQALAPYASQLYLHLAQMHYEKLSKLESKNIQMDFWLKPALIHLLYSNPREAQLLNDYYIPKLLKFFGATSVPYIVACLRNEELKQRKLAEKSGFLKCLVMCLRTSQRLGLLDQKKTPDNGQCGDATSSIDSNLIKSAFVHQDNQVRLDSFRLLCESWKPTTLISPSDLDLIKFGLPYNMTCQCPAFRQELINTIKKDFEFWLTEFCLDNLFEGASYPRKSLALNIFHFLITSHLKSRKDVNYLHKLLSFRRIVMIVALLKDGFDDNRVLSLNILTDNVLKVHVRQSLSCSFLWNLVETSLENGRKSCKPEVCHDAAYNLRLAARLHQSTDKNIITLCKYFVSSLRYDVKIASKNLLKAAQTGPMHGCLLCLRMLLMDANIKGEHFSAYRKLIADCITLCFQVASAVFPVVGSESPEGGIPEVGTEIELPEIHQRRYTKLLQLLLAQIKPEQRNSDDERVSGQRMLVMCWRSAKESYLLLQLISSLPSKCLNDEDVALLSTEQFLKIGEHLRSQLMDTVHRGTFEVAYSVFREYCPLLWRSKDLALNSYPKKWVYDTVNDICDTDKAKSVCSTRRSAGLPFFLQALVGSDKSQVSRECLCHVMDSLLPLVSRDIISDLKDDDECIQQVHALNVIRGLIKDASLGEDMFPYLSKCVVAAITGFGSTIWKIRNSSTLLFSALITRIFGVKKEKDLETSGKNRLSSREFFTRMPELDEFLLEHLKTNLDEKIKESDIEQDSRLYPVLLMLSRVYPSPSKQQGAAEPLINYQPLLMRCGHSPIHKCRVMAANAVASGVTSEDSVKLLTHLANSLSHEAPSNQIHGTLLQIHKLVNMHLSDVSNLSKNFKHFSNVVNVIAAKAELGTLKTSCLVVRSAYTNLCLELSSLYFKMLKAGDASDLLALSQAIHSLLEILLQESLAYQTGANAYLPGHTMLSESSGRLFASCWIWGITCDSSYPLHCNNYDVTYAFLRTLKTHLKNKKKLIAFKSTEAVGQLEKVLVQIASMPLDRRCQSKVFSLLALLISKSYSVKVLELARQLVDELFWKHEKLVGAVVLCQAACLKFIIAEENSANSLDWIQEFGVFLEKVSSNLRQANVSLCVADALRTLAVDFFLKKSFGVVFAGAWRVLFILLVDEDEHVRKAANQIVHDIAELSKFESSGEPVVDSLSLEIAMDCLLALNDTDSVFLPKIMQFLSDMADQQKQEENPLDGSAGLFKRGASNVFIEPLILKQLAGKVVAKIGVNSTKS